MRTEIASAKRDMVHIGKLGALCATMMVVTLFSWLFFGGIISLALYFLTQFIMILTIAKFTMASAHIKAVEKFDRDMREQYNASKRKD
jgi:cobalamin biosynthesis protein CobD/CbiB